MGEQSASRAAAGLTPHAIYERDAPGVVFVRAQIVQQLDDPFDLFPRQQSSVSTGSGFLIDLRGYLLTNYHLIEGASGVSVQFEDNVARRAAVIGDDPNNDLALLKVDMSGVTPIQPLLLGDSTTIRVGGGNGSVGIAFAVPINTAKDFLPRLERGGQVQIAYLGIAGKPTRGPQPGVVIERAQAGGPAASAGLRKGDEIDRVGGAPVASMDQLQEVVEARAPGQRIPILIRRAGRAHTITVMLDSRPAQAP
jgi:S1-C subfamily serine protease